jgi:hypothetical protein
VSERRKVRKIRKREKSLGREFYASVRRLPSNIACKETGRENVAIIMPYFIWKVVSEKRDLRVKGERLEIREFYEV